MLRVSKDSVPRPDEDYKVLHGAGNASASTGTATGQFSNIEELEIATAAATGGQDPLLIVKTEEPQEPLLLVKRSIVASGPVRTYLKKQPKQPKRLSTFLPKDSLKPMVYEALGKVRRAKFFGARPRDIKSFILSKYDINVERVQVGEVIKEGIDKGEILQYKRNGKTPMQRFRLSRKFNPPNNNRGPKETDESVFSSRSTGLNNSEKINDGSESNDNDIQSSGRFIDPNFIKVEEISEGEMSSLLGNKKRVKSSVHRSKVQKTDGDPRSANEIDFMVLHSLHTSHNAAGLRINEIAESIRSFYGVDVPKSLPRIERYLKYSIEKGSVIKNGDRYKKKLATSNVNLARKIDSQELQKSGSGGPDKKFFLTEVKLEPGEAENFLNSRLATDHGRVEINVNNNVIQSIGKRPEPKIVKTFKIKRKNFIHGKHVPFCSTIEKEAEQNKFQLSKIEPGLTRQEGLKDAKVSLVRYVENKNLIELLDPSKSNGAIPDHSEAIKLFLEEKKYARIISELNDAFHTPTYCKHDLSVFRVKERKELRNQKELGHDNYGINPSPKRYGRRRPAMKYGLGIVINYLSQNPMIVLKNSATLTRNLSWKQIALTKTNFCLKLTGESSPSSVALNCEACGSQLTFGSFNCPVCSFELENVIEKCDICHLLCNRGDVFLKHFLWEHKPFLEHWNYDDTLSVADENIVKLLKKLADGDLFHCRLCMYLSDDIKAFEVHIVGNHTTKMNVFPAFPEVDNTDKVSIFRNEISNTCCYECKECGFISNRRDFVVYHMLEVHIVVEKENYEELLWNLETKDMKRYLGRNKPNVPLCSYCGKFYNNLSSHMATHTGGRRKRLQSIEGQPSSLANATLRQPGRPVRKKQSQPIKTNHLLCHICGKRMNRRIQEHIRSHSSEMYPCTICGKEFNRESNLFTHKRVHTREKPFQCDICKMRFGYKCSIKGHIINVHSETV